MDELPVKYEYVRLAGKGWEGQLRTTICMRVFAGSELETRPLFPRISTPTPTYRESEDQSMGLWATSVKKDQHLALRLLQALYAPLKETLTSLCSPGQFVPLRGSHLGPSQGEKSFERL